MPNYFIMCSAQNFNSFNKAFFLHYDIRNVLLGPHFTVSLQENVKINFDSEIKNGKRNATKWLQVDCKIVRLLNIKNR